ncbi:MAG: hypothetical protein ACRD8W_10910 [Nitrososphaeraceae archaeon]
MTETVLITGATATVGSEVVRQLANVLMLRQQVIHYKSLKML